MLWEVKTNSSTTYRLLTTVSFEYGTCLMTINYSTNAKNYKAILCSKLNLIQTKLYFHLLTDLHSRPVRFRELHNLFYIFPFSEWLSFSQTQLLLLLRLFCPFTACGSFVPFSWNLLSWFIYPRINISQISWLANIQINSMNKIRITALCGLLFFENYKILSWYKQHQSVPNVYVLMDNWYVENKVVNL